MDEELYGKLIEIYDRALGDKEAFIHKARLIGDYHPGTLEVVFFSFKMMDEYWHNKIDSVLHGEL